jgi:HAD superfamily hydrolase (TIGR01490 family)
MALAIFDLDNTLLGGDSDHLWGEYLCEIGLADADEFGRQVDTFYQDYLRGELDIARYLRFILGPTAGMSDTDLAPIRASFLREKIEPIVLPASLALIEQHRRNGDTLLIITATVDLVTAPIAARLGIDHLLASMAEQQNGRYTGLPTGIPCLREGKVARLEAWLEANPGLTLTDSCFYSDSHNDLPLLRRVTHPIAVDPDPQLAAVAAHEGWPRMTLREA